MGEHIQRAGDFVLFSVMPNCDEESILALKNGINIEANLVDLSPSHIQHEYRNLILLLYKLRV